LDNASGILEEQGQGEAITGQGFEIEPLVESLCFIVLGMDE